MKIEINTAEESAQNLRRLARFLKELSSDTPQAPSSPNDSDDSSGDEFVSSGAFGLFDDDSSDEESVRGEPETVEESFRVMKY